MDPQVWTGSAPLWQHWLFGQPALVVVLLLAIAALVYDRTRLERSRERLLLRNEALSDYLVRAIEKHSSEQVRVHASHTMQLDGIVRAQNESAAAVLSRVVGSLGNSRWHSGDTNDG